MIYFMEFQHREKTSKNCRNGEARGKKPKGILSFMASYRKKDSQILNVIKISFSIQDTLLRILNWILLTC